MTKIKFMYSDEEEIVDVTSEGKDLGIDQIEAVESLGELFFEFGNDMKLGEFYNMLEDYFQFDITLDDDDVEEMVFGE